MTSIPETPIAQHTPGPWEVGTNQHPSSENFGHPAIGAKGREYAIAVLPLNDDEAAANARLIAAAPELLDVAEDLLAAYCEARERLYDSGLPSKADAVKARGLKHKARAVITKATLADAGKAVTP